MKQTTKHFPHPNLPVPANEQLLVWVGDEILPRESAEVASYQYNDYKFSLKDVASSHAVLWLFLFLLI